MRHVFDFVSIMNYLLMVEYFVVETKGVIEDTGCGLNINPEPWENKELLWQEKNFVKYVGHAFF